MGISTITTEMKKIATAIDSDLSYTDGKWQKLPKCPFCVILNPKARRTEHNAGYELDEAFSVLFVDALKNHSNDYATALDSVTDTANNFCNDLIKSTVVEIVSISNDIEKTRDSIDNIEVVSAQVEIIIES